MLFHGTCHVGNYGFFTDQNWIGSIVVSQLVPTDTPTDFELGDKADDIQRRREEREQRRRRQRNNRGRRGRKSGGRKLHDDRWMRQWPKMTKN